MRQRRVIKVDKKNRFKSYFDPNTGFYFRTGVIDKDGKDTGVDPFMASFPELIDVGIMSKCVCSHLCKVGCYQKAAEKQGENMSLKNFEKICKEASGKTYQFALGGAGDVDTHEHFEEILKMCRDYNIVPNFTTSGLMMTEGKAKICKKYVGACAVSEHFAEYTDKAINMLIAAGVMTNLHYVVSNKTIDDAIYKLKNHAFRKDLNAIVFLLCKNVGYATADDILDINDPRVQEFYKLLDDPDLPYTVGLDSCQIPAVVNFAPNINPNCYDTCEGGRWSAYITPDMKLLPCSFDNQELRWAYDISDDTIQNGWDSEIFEDFRSHFKNSCSACKNKKDCMGGCAIRREIVLCNRKEKDLQ